jgi:hypothetical protein
MKESVKVPTCQLGGPTKVHLIADAAVNQESARKPRAARMRIAAVARRLSVVIGCALQ